jgi:hypothetical protein
MPPKYNSKSEKRQKLQQQSKRKQKKQRHLKYKRRIRTNRESKTEIIRSFENPQHLQVAINEEREKYYLHYRKPSKFIHLFPGRDETDVCSE